MLFNRLLTKLFLIQRTCWVLLVLCCTVSVMSQDADDDEEDDDYPPGIVATYTLDGKSVQRIDTEIAFDWQADSPDARLPQGKFAAKWQSQLLIKQATNYRFHAYVEGDVKIVVKKKVVLKGSQKQAGWVSGQLVALDFGEKELEVHYQKTGQKAVLKIFWSADTFDVEPLPAHQLFHEAGFSKLKRIEKGRQQFVAHRCNRCHVRSNELLSKSSPALTHIGFGTNVNWLASKIESLSKKGNKKSHRKMPSFGMSKADAQAVAAFLMSHRKKTTLFRLPKKKKKAPKNEVNEGRILIRSMGCLACHTIGKFGETGLFGGNNLSHEGDKRTREWIYTWLKEPRKLNKEHRMPIFRMSNTQRRQLSAYLENLGKPFETNTPQWANDKKNILRGKQLVVQANCAACHTIPNIKAKKRELTDLSQPITDWSDSCLAEKANLAKGRPVYQSVDKKSIKEYLASQVGSRSSFSQYERGAHTFMTRNCMACHKRGNGLGNTKIAGQIAAVENRFKGKSHAMIPPSLSAVGDKLRDESLAEWVSGEYKKSRLPWLSVGMPRFKHTKEEKGNLLHYLKTNDRIPANRPLHRKKLVPLPKGTESLVMGHALVGPKGFSCIACHTIGKYTPKNTAPGTRGAQLMMIGKRVRKEFFMRWVRSPLRIVPGMEMPGYKKPVAGLLENNSDWQIEAVWNALNNPLFKPPTNPSVVEQFIVVKPNGVRIIRDIFTNPKENGSDATIPRSFAIGFGNKNNFLFDLSVMSLRQWTIGDFARQRVAGKSWYWDMAGLPVMQGFERRSDYALQREGKPDSQLIFPTSKNDQVGRLLKYQVGTGLSSNFPDHDKVLFSFQMNFDLNGKQKSIVITESIDPRNLKTGQGQIVDRAVKVKKIPQGYRLVFLKPNVKATLGSPRITVAWSNKWMKSSKVIQRQNVQYFMRPKRYGKNKSEVDFIIYYDAHITPPTLPVKTVPAVPLPVEKVTSLPGYDGLRLPIDRSIMPTAMTFTSKGKLAFTSLKGHVYIAEDTNGDGIQDKLRLFEEGLASPYGILADGDDLIVCHKPEILRLSDTNGDGRADKRTVIATGWGYTNNYHDWTCGLVRDHKKNLYFSLGSDYSQSKRHISRQRWRGKVIQLAPDGTMTPIAHAFRYPTGVAMDHQERIFVSDQQGVQNCFNEINYVQKGKYYGVWSREDQRIKPQPPEEKPAIQVPHDWTRSVNGLFFLPQKKTGKKNSPFAGDGIGCEYTNKFLIRYTTEEVRGVLQGATYAFSRKDAGTGDDNFYGPLCGAVAPNGDIYIGSVADSGWSGGQNNGRITRLRANGKMPNGIKKINVMKDGFRISFTQSIDKKAAALIDGYSLSGYRRVWQGDYATPDSGRHKVTVQSVDVAADGMSLQLHVTGLKEGYLYEVSCGKIGTKSQRTLFPATGYYTLHKLPKK